VLGYFSTTLVVQVEKSVKCIYVYVCVAVCVDLTVCRDSKF